MRRLLPLVLLSAVLWAPHASFASGAPTTTTTLGQTMAKPPAHSAPLDARMRNFFTGLATNNNELAISAFLPQSAYVVIKSGSNNAVDWKYRLIDHDFIPQLKTLRHQFGADLATATYLGYHVNEAEAHICPVGREENKAPYWQAYMTTIDFTMKNVTRHLTVNTMISWRGGWFIVHVIGYG
jgi:hypothetical protein